MADELRDEVAKSIINCAGQLEYHRGRLRELADRAVRLGGIARYVSDELGRIVTETATLTAALVDEWRRITGTSVTIGEYAKHSAASKHAATPSAASRAARRRHRAKPR